MTITTTGLWLLQSLAFATPINLEKSTLKWTGQKPTSEHWGSLQFESADIVIRKGQWVGGEFTVDMTSITVDDFSGPGADKLLRHLRNDDFFAVDKFETAKLRITDTDKNQITGNLTIKGQTHPIVFSYVNNESSYSGKMIFDRTLYGITYKSKSVIEGLGDKFIKDKVIVEFNIVFDEK